MKKVIYVVAMGALLIGTVACKDKASAKIVGENVETASVRDEGAKKVPVMQFDKTEHDFGTIENGTPQQTIFKFTNAGDGPLIITDAKSSCGCTVPEYPKNTPIAPGDSGELLVKFNGSGQNQVTKTITVTANTAKGSELLRIKAFVTPKDGAAISVPMKKG
ncbi:DUF1573 domain-containing protein [Flavobacterium sp. ASW18X]|uniref:DUF1573 domain-containing protein n=1 Tax=Flavobacterium sp. ASW18X TaxID=2572595 RepID=UPI0010ADFF57|nr:DUF1573 domain-containing protein [Flavobacterium sp. ASW18X]TKD61352.1 DUF1573 domain-containing protein [Flavobacterium sp. ASW18X]